MSRLSSEATRNILFLGRTDASLQSQVLSRIQKLIHIASSETRHSINIFAQTFKSIQNIEPKYTITRIALLRGNAPFTEQRIASSIADPASIEDFVAWSRSFGAASFEVLWYFSHGTGGYPPELRHDLTKSDNQSRDWTPEVLQLAELEIALNAVGQVKPLDILFLEACGVGQIETLGAVRHGTRHLVATSQWADDSDVPHEYWLDTVANGTHQSPIDPSDISRRMLASQAYRAVSEDPKGRPKHETHVGIALRTDTYDEITALSRELIQRHISTASGPRQRIGIFDFWRFMAQLASCLPESERERLAILRLRKLTQISAYAAHGAVSDDVISLGIAIFPSNSSSFAKEVCLKDLLTPPHGGTVSRLKIIELRNLYNEILNSIHPDEYIKEGELPDTHPMFILHTRLHAFYNVVDELDVEVLDRNHKELRTSLFRPTSQFNNTEQYNVIRSLSFIIAAHRTAENPASLSARQAAPYIIPDGTLGY